MEQFDRAMARLDSAVSRLEGALADGEEIWGVEDGDLPVLKAERDRLAGEVETLRAQTQADAQLRVEAASAVRQALEDLRGAVGGGGQPRA